MKRIVLIILGVFALLSLILANNFVEILLSVISLGIILKLLERK